MEGFHKEFWFLGVFSENFVDFGQKLWSYGLVWGRRAPTLCCLNLQKGWEDVALQNEGLMFNNRLPVGVSNLPCVLDRFSKDCTQGFTGVDSGLFDQFCTILSWVHDGYANMEKELGKERERKLMECARKRELGET